MQPKTPVARDSQSFLQVTEDQSRLPLSRRARALMDSFALCTCNNARELQRAASKFASSLRQVENEAENAPAERRQQPVQSRLSALEELAFSWALPNVKAPGLREEQVRRLREFGIPIEFGVLRDIPTHSESENCISRARREHGRSGLAGLEKLYKFLEESQQIAERQSKQSSGKAFYVRVQKLMYVPSNRLVECLGQLTFVILCVSHEFWISKHWKWCHRSPGKQPLRVMLASPLSQQWAELMGAEISTLHLDDTFSTCETGVRLFAIIATSPRSGRGEYLVHASTTVAAPL